MLTGMLKVMNLRQLSGRVNRENAPFAAPQKNNSFAQMYFCPACCALQSAELNLQGLQVGVGHTVDDKTSYPGDTLWHFSSLSERTAADESRSTSCVKNL